MFQGLKIENVELFTESPYIISINGNFQLIGHEARAFSVYLFSDKVIGETVTVRGDYRTDGNFIIKKMIIPKYLRDQLKGTLINTMA